MFALDRDVWRFEYGRLAPELLEIKLRDEIPGLTAQRVDLAANRSTIGVWDHGGLIAAHARAFDQAVRSVNTKRFRTAVRSIRRCGELHSTAMTLLHAARGIDAATAIWKRLHQSVLIDLLRRLPAVASLSQAGEAARHSLNAGRYGESAEIARLCSRMGTSLLERNIAGANQDHDLLLRLAAILDLHQATTFCAQPPDDEVPRAVQILRELLIESYTVLVSRLCTELEIELSARRRFRDFVERARLNRAFTLGTDDELRTVVDALSWDGAVEYYWHESIAQYSSGLQRIRERAAAVRDELTQLLASGD